MIKETIILEMPNGTFKTQRLEPFKDHPFTDEDYIISSLFKQLHLLKCGKNKRFDSTIRKKYDDPDTYSHIAYVKNKSAAKLDIYKEFGKDCIIISLYEFKIK